MVGPKAQSTRRRIRRELAGVYTRGLGEKPDPLTFRGVLLSCPGTPLDSCWLGGGAHLRVELGDVDVTEHGPEEADHLTGDGGGGHPVGLLGGEAVEEGVEPILTRPGVANDVEVLTSTASPNGRSEDSRRKNRDSLRRLLPVSPLLLGALSMSSLRA